jgi:hypothetical protein
VLRILLEKEKELRLCGATVHAKVLQIVPHKCKYRKCVLHRFFNVNFHFFSVNFLYASTGIICSYLY